MELEWILIVCMAGIAAIVALGMYLSAKNGYKDTVFRALYTLVCRAEPTFEGSGRGVEKKAWVIQRIREILPKWAKIFISEEDIENLLELAVDKMKEFLENKAQED